MAVHKAASPQIVCRGTIRRGGCPYNFDTTIVATFLEFAMDLPRICEKSRLADLSVATILS